MTSRKKLIVTAAACGACCAAALAIAPALTALGFAGAGVSLAAWTGWFEIAAATIMVSAAGLGIVVWRRRRRAARNSCSIPVGHPSQPSRPLPSA
jgi:hypothetical protein